MLVLLLLHSLIIASILMWMFDTHIVRDLFVISKKLGIKKNDKSFWPTDTNDWDKTSFEIWKVCHLNRFWSGVLSCPMCASLHGSYISAIAMYVLGYIQPIEAAILVVASPILANIIFKIHRDDR